MQDHFSIPCHVHTTVTRCTHHVGQSF